MSDGQPRGARRKLGPAGGGAARSVTASRHLLFAGDEPLEPLRGRRRRPTAPAATSSGTPRARSSAPLIPRSRASLQERMASMTTPAELGESHTSSFSSTLMGWSPKPAALEPDVGPLAVREPRHVVARADVDRVGGQLVAELRADGVGLRDLLRGEPVALEHVVEVGVAAEVQLAGAVEPDAAVVEELGEHAVDDGRAHLRLHVVAHHRAARAPRSGAASRPRAR